MTLGIGDFCVRPLRLTGCLLFFMLLSPGGQAAPTGPEGIPVDAQQPDGTVLDIRGVGDEFYHRYETAEGYTVVRDRQVNVWYYAQPSADGSDLVPGPLVVGRDDPAAGGLAKHLDRSAEAVQKIVADRYDRFVVPSNWERRRLEGQIARLHSLGAKDTVDALIQTYNTRYAPMGYQAIPSPDQAPRFSSLDVPDYTPPPTMGRTSVIALCILAKFPDQPAPVASRTQMDALINQANYTDSNGNTGSVRDYFYAQSFGRLTYTAVVTDYITADHPRSYYANQESCYGALELIKECVGKVSGVNLSSLTKDGSTAIAVYLLYAGATSYDGLWPHQWTLTGYSLPDGTRVGDYMVSSIGATPVVGTICHESGHMVLNCSDYYDYGNGRYGSGDSVKSAGVGEHCLMGAGNYLNGGKTPAPLNAYLKYKLGWASAVDMPSSGSLSVGAADQQFRRLVKPGVPTEYFIVENKSKGASLPWNGAMVDEGLAVWHVDEAVTTGNELQQRTSAKHYELSLEQADGRFDLETGADLNRGDSTDYFDGAPGRNEFSPNTTPSSKWWDGSSSALILENISAPGATVTFTISTGEGGLQAPILNAEPATTPGSENTIYWQEISEAAAAANMLALTGRSPEVQLNAVDPVVSATIPCVGSGPRTRTLAGPLESGTAGSGKTSLVLLSPASTGPTATTEGVGPAASGAPDTGVSHEALEAATSTMAGSADEMEQAADRVPNGVQAVVSSSEAADMAVSHEKADVVLTAQTRPENVALPEVADEQKGEAGDAPQRTATQLLSETFEGAFPGSAWTLHGSPTWDDTSYDMHGGSWSGWCADSSVMPSSGYPNNMNSWMVYGPFSLSDATVARLNFWYKNYSEVSCDYFKWMASVDGNQFYGYAVSGSQNSWRSQTFDLTAVPTLGNLCGRSQVWIAFVFISDSSVCGPTYTGAFLDDVVLEKEGAADLTVHKPANWNDKIPVGTTQLNWDADHSYSGAYYDNQQLYFNWGSLNQGGGTAAGYKVHLEVTGTGGGSWNWTSLTTEPTYWTHLTTDVAVGPLSAGTHTFKVWVDYDGVVSESNENNNYYERTITVASASAVNLLPYQPSGWADKIVVSKVSGTKSDDSPLYDTDTLYVDWAQINSGSSATAVRFHTELYVDGVLKRTWYTDPPCDPSSWQYVSDFSIGTLSAGTHSVKIKVDSAGEITESNEADNEYTKTITVRSSPLPNLTPYQPSDWSDKIVVSKVTGTHADDGNIRDTDLLYVDWALINSGSASTTARFHTELYVDGVLTHTWFSDPPVSPSGWQFASDYAIGALAAGTHAIRVKVDSAGEIGESNEGDNEYTKTVTVISSSLPPNLKPYQPSGWSDAIVVSASTGTFTDETPLYDTDTLYVDWAVINNGAAATAVRFYTQLYVDGALQASWYTEPPLNPNTAYAFVPDYVIGTLAAGTHTVKIKVDSGGAVTESNESDNEYTKTINVVSSSLANLAPYLPSGWSDKIVVSKVMDTHTDDGSLHETDTLYVDWALINNGLSATGVRFYSQLFVDGTLQATWYSDPPVNSGSGQYAADYSIGRLSAGTHTVRIKVDSSNAITESNESDNEYTKTVTIIGGDETVEYYAECDDDPAFGSPANSGWQADTQYTFDNLSSGVKYYYRVKARRGSSLESGWSNIEFSSQGSGGGVSLSEAVDDVAGLSWSIEGSASWLGQTDTSHDSVDAAQSGDVEDDQLSALKTSVTGPGTLSFWWKVSSEASWDYLRFYIDGTEQQGAISGVSGWQQKTFVLGAGAHALKWAYTKDGSVSSGDDCGWLDQVVWQSSATTIVTFDAQGGTSPVPASKNVTYGAPYGALATTTRIGYTFGGWFTGAGGTGAQVTESTVVSLAANHTLYAKWTANAYTVTFDAQGGSVPNPQSKSVSYGLAYGSLATVSRTGYSFGGWWTGVGGTGSQVTDVSLVTTAASHTLYAKWTANVYSVTFDAQGGAAPNPAGKSVTYGSSYGALPVTTRTGYIFAGWWTGIGGAGSQVTASSVVATTANHTLYAKWTAITCAVTFDARGGTVSQPSKTVTYGSAYGTLPVPVAPAAAVRVGQTFDGWYTGANGTGSRVLPSTVVTRVTNHTLYANWIMDSYISDPQEDADLAAAGTYDGYFYNESAFGEGTAVSVRGTFTLTITSMAGKLTAKAVVQKGTLSFSSTAWMSVADGTYRAILSTRTGERLDLYVRQNRVWGTLDAAGETLTMDGARSRFSDAKDTVAQTLLGRYKGYYTAQLGIADAVSAGWVDAAPQGTGYLTLTVGSGGSVKVAGVLADGTAVSQSSRLIVFDAADGWACVPFFAALYTKQGSIGGLLWIDPNTGAVLCDSDLSWFVRWQKPGAGPDGFGELIDPRGCYYSPTPWLASHYRFEAEPDGVRYYAGGEYLELIWDSLYDGIGVTAVGTRMTMDKGIAPLKLNDGQGGYSYYYGVVNSAMATLTFTANSGVFKGSFKGYCDYLDGSGRLQHKSVSVSYAGVMVPEGRGATLTRGDGYCLVPDNDPVVKAFKIKRSFPVRLFADE